MGKEEIAEASVDGRIQRSKFRFETEIRSIGKEEIAEASIDGRIERSKFPSSKEAAPWLVIPYGKSGIPRKQAFYDITCEDPNNKTRRFRKSIPELIAKRFWQKPSHQGWLIIMCDDENYDYSDQNLKYGDCFLLNPATLETICLPSLSYWYGESTGYYFQDCVLSSDPDCDNSLVLFVFSNRIEGDPQLLFLYCVPGEQIWRTEKMVVASSLSYSEARLIRNMVSLHYFKDAFYLMCKAGQHLRISTVWDSDGRILLVMDTIDVKDMGSYPSVGGVKTSWVASNFVATDDQLYFIPVTYTLRGFRSVVLQIAVLRLDFYEMAWEMVHSIGDHVLFIGSSSSTTACCSAADMGLSRGCLYFTLPDDQSLYKFDIESTGNSVIVPRLKVPKPWKGSEFIMMPNGGQKNAKRRREEDMVSKDKVYLNLKSSSATRDTWIYPWLMFCTDHHFATFGFVSSMVNTESYTFSSLDLVQTLIRFQKGGWLLVSTENNKFGLFLHNPFTRETIKLPELPVEYTFSSASFTSLPTSPDCVVFAIEQGMHCQVRIHFIRKGQSSWSSFLFTNNANTEKYVPSHNTPVFYNGVFYCVDYNGSLGVFNIEDYRISWEVLEKPHPQFDAVYPSFLVECGGELLLVKLGRLGMMFGIFKLDVSQMNWVEQKNLGNHMLFVSHTSCFSAIAPLNSRMENKVYFPRLRMSGEGEEVLFYCLETRSYGSFGSQHSASDFTDTKGWYLNCTWIQPNCSKSTTQGLDWVNCPS